MEWANYIHADPKILGGKPVIKGTRISVELFERLAHGWTEDLLVGSYPHLLEESLWFAQNQALSRRVGCFFVFR